MEHDPDQVHDPHPARKPHLLTFSEDDFLTVAKKLHRKYPSQWIALAILTRDVERGITTGEVLAHSETQALTLQGVAAYQAQHPGTPVRYFTTDLALSRASSV